MLGLQEAKLEEHETQMQVVQKKLDESRAEYEQQILTTKQEKDIEILKAKDNALQAEHKLADLSEFMAKKVRGIDDMSEAKVILTCSAEPPIWCSTDIMTEPGSTSL